MELQTAARYRLLDELRGLDLISMMLYHGMWDVVFLFGVAQKWYTGRPGFVWQQSICWVFILLSGFCLPLGHRPLRRGLIVSGGEPSSSGQGRWSQPSPCSSCPRTWCGSGC